LIELTDSNYDKLIAEDKIIFIDFYSPTCGPCAQLKSMLPHISKFATEKSALVYKTDVSTNPKIANKFMVRSVPMTCIVDLEKNIKDVEIGLKDVGFYISLIEKHTSKKEGFFSRFFKKKK
jgi:thioredoxin-like negative regulator of GroEL